MIENYVYGVAYKRESPIFVFKPFDGLKFISLRYRINFILLFEHRFILEFENFHAAYSKTQRDDC